MHFVILNYHLDISKLFYKNIDYYDVILYNTTKKEFSKDIIL
jgi:hypothetical protein